MLDVTRTGERRGPLESTCDLPTRATKKRTMRTPHLVLLGEESPSGTYLLHLRVHETVALAFGRFKKGKRIVVPAGEYLYIGSALGKRGAVSLARRLVRHATRTGDRPPHPIRELLLARFAEIGLASGDLRPRKGKTLFWNIDHLVDLPVVEIVGVYVLRSRRRLERALGESLLADSALSIVEKGLGANDLPGMTNLLRVDADADWWEALPARLSDLVAACGNVSDRGTRSVLRKTE